MCNCCLTHSTKCSSFTIMVRNAKSIASVIAFWTPKIIACTFKSMTCLSFVILPHEGSHTPISYGRKRQIVTPQSWDQASSAYQTIPPSFYATVVTLLLFESVGKRLQIVEPITRFLVHYDAQTPSGLLWGLCLCRSALFTSTRRMSRCFQCCGWWM